MSLCMKAVAFKSVEKAVKEAEKLKDADKEFAKAEQATLNRRYRLQNISEGGDFEKKLTTTQRSKAAKAVAEAEKAVTDAEKAITQAEQAKNKRKVVAKTWNKNSCRGGRTSRAADDGGSQQKAQEVACKRRP